MSTEASERGVVRAKPKLARSLVRYLKLREEMKRRKPRFVRMDSWAKPSIAKSSWRRPKGLDNKIRLQLKGYPEKVKAGYRGPREVRGLHPSGFREVIVHNVEELSRVDPEREAVRIASTVGRRKRMEIIERAAELGIRILNPGVRE